MGGSNPPSPPPPDRGVCPETIDATVTGPAPGILPSSWLDVELAGATSPSVVLVDPVDGRRVGSLAGIAGLGTLARCIRDGVVYRAFVESVEGGRVSVTVTRQ